MFFSWEKQVFQIFSPLMSYGCGIGKEIIQLLPVGRAGYYSRIFSGLEESWISQEKKKPL